MKNLLTLFFIFFFVGCQAVKKTTQPVSLTPLLDQHPCRVNLLRHSPGLKCWLNQDENSLIIHAQNNTINGTQRLEILYSQGSLPNKIILRIYQQHFFSFKVTNKTITLQYDMREDMQTFSKKHASKTTKSLVDINSEYWCQPFSNYSKEYGNYTDFIIGKEIINQFSQQFAEEKNPMIISFYWTGRNPLKNE